jgi:hypothetical protein
MEEVRRIAEDFSAVYVVMRKDTGEKKEEIELMRQARDGWCGGTGERRDERLGLAPRVIRDARCWVVLVLAGCHATLRELDLDQLSPLPL